MGKRLLDEERDRKAKAARAREERLALEGQQQQDRAYAALRRLDLLFAGGSGIPYEMSEIRVRRTSDGSGDFLGMAKLREGGVAKVSFNVGDRASDAFLGLCVRLAEGRAKLVDDRYAHDNGEGTPNPAEIGAEASQLLLPGVEK